MTKVGTKVPQIQKRLNNQRAILSQNGYCEKSAWHSKFKSLTAAATGKARILFRACANGLALEAHPSEQTLRWYQRWYMICLWNGSMNHSARNATHRLFFLLVQRVPHAHLKLKEYGYHRAQNLEMDQYNSPCYWTFCSQNNARRKQTIVI